MLINSVVFIDSLFVLFGSLGVDLGVGLSLRFAWFWFIVFVWYWLVAVCCVGWPACLQLL